MKRFFSQHMSSLIEIAAGLAIIALVGIYGAKGGTFDTNMQKMFETTTSNVIVDSNVEVE